MTMIGDSNLQRIAVESVRQRGFHAIDSLPGNAFDALLSAQRMRFDEEWGEFNRALRKNEIQGMRDELADVQIVLYQIAHILEINLASEVVRKLSADEKRGYLHGDKDDGPASQNEVANEHIIEHEHGDIIGWHMTKPKRITYPQTVERLIVGDYADGAGV